MTASTDNVIRRTYHGGTEDMSFEEFARSAIQDEQVARQVAENMLDCPDEPYEWNPHEPEFYETFEVIDANALRAAITSSEGS